MADLDAGRLVEEAQRITGLEDCGDDSFRVGLELYVQALEGEAELNDLGRTIVEGEIVGHLTNRLCITAERRARPELATRDIVAPLFIIGQGRTGTTILHDLLAQDPRHRVALTWEVAKPCPPPETATYDTDPRIAESEATSSMVDLVIPGFRAMHPLGPRLAQECVAMTAADFRSMMFPVQYRVPSYARWLVHEADMAPAYRWHRQFLQHLQSRHSRDRWVLKSPGHIWCLDALLTEYPDALLVQTHRDPLRIVASIGSLVSTLRRLASDESTIPIAAAEFADYILEGLDRSVTARVDGTVAPDRVVDVHFGAFMADPFATIRTVYERLGMHVTDDAEARMRTFLAEHGADQYGTHTYTFAETGLDEGALRARARRYQEYFDVPSERLP
jgi:hypothetical protein